MKINFPNKVAKIIQEEAKKIVLREAPKVKISFEDWALNHLKSNYGDKLPSSINKGNVVAFLQGSKFKLTPEEFEARKNVNTSFKSLENQYKLRGKVADLPDLTSNQQDAEEGDEEQQAVSSKLDYRSGAVPLEDIARELGDITKMGVSKKIDDALGKLQRFGVDRAGENNLNSKITRAREDGAKEFVDLLVASRGNISAFLKALEANKMVKLALDVGQDLDDEKKALKSLYDSIKTNGNDKELGIEMLLSDIEDNEPSERVWKTYQAVVARKASPRKNKVAEQD